MSGHPQLGMKQESLTGFRTNELMKLESIQEFLRKRKESKQELLDEECEIQRLMNIGSLS
jgi:hypothetical protein